MKTNRTRRRMLMGVPALAAALTIGLSVADASQAQEEPTTTTSIGSLPPQEPTTTSIGSLPPPPETTTTEVPAERDAAEPATPQPGSPNFTG